MILAAFFSCGHGVPGASGPASGQAGLMAGQGLPIGIGSAFGQAGFTESAPCAHCSPTWQGFSFDPLGLLLSAAVPPAATAPGTCGKRGGLGSGSALRTTAPRDSAQWILTSYSPASPRFEA